MNDVMKKIICGRSDRENMAEIYITLWFFFEFLKEVSCSARNISSRQFAGICEGNKFFISMIDSSPCCSFLLYRMSDSGYVLNFFSEICIRIRVLHDRANVFCIPI